MKKQIDNILGGSRKSEVGSPKWEPGFDSLFNHCSNLFAPLSTFTQEVGSRKSEVGSLKGTPVSDSLFLIFYFLFPGKGKENKEHRITNNEYRISNNEVGSQKSEVRSSSGTPVSYFLFLIFYFLFPGKGKENKEYRISNIEYRIRKSEVRSRKSEVGSPKPEPVFDSCKSNLLAPLSPLAKGDEIRPLVAGSEGVVTPANAGKENKEHRIMNNEYRITNNESGSFLGNLVSDSLFPEKGKENNEHRISNNEYRIRKAEDGIRNLTGNDTSTSFLSPSPFGEGRGEANNESGSFLGNLVSDSLFPVERPGRLIIYFLFPGKGKRPETTPGRVEIAPGIRKMTQGQVKTTPEFKKMTQGRVKTTPEFKKMTHGWLKIAPGIKKMTHGRVKIASGIRKMTQGRVKTAPGRVEYAPGPLPAPHGTILPCAFTAAWYRVGRPEKPEMGLIKGENKEQRISNNEYRIRKAEDGIRNLTSNDTSTSFLSPSPFGEGRGEAKYKTLSRLPQESGFNSGDCPGAAAITIFYSFYSSPRVSPNFAGATQKNLPVANQQAFHQGSIVPLFRGTSPGYPGRRGYLPFHRNLMFEALYQKGGTPMS